MSMVHEVVTQRHSAASLTRAWTANDLGWTTETDTFWCCHGDAHPVSICEVTSDVCEERT